jgi:N,N'-diacetyllegionaminate synthase
MKHLNFRLDSNSAPYIIAEAGINHNGDIKTALKLIEAANKSGADAIKFQTYKSELFISPESKYYNIFKNCELSFEDIKLLVEKAKSLNITIFSAVFDFFSADLWQKLDTPMFKIASGDITHHPLLAYVAKFNKPIILSTGGSSIKEIASAVKAIYDSNPSTKLAILHCVSKYPTNNNEANLLSMKTIKDMFNVPVGFSDHTEGEITSTSAVALGASIIEKHFTLNNDMDGPDHKLSINPENFKIYINKLHSIFNTLGLGSKEVIEGAEIINAIRRSLIAGKNIYKGEIINLDNIIFRRPQNGIPANEFYKVNGKKALKDISKNSKIELDDF